MTAERIKALEDALRPFADFAAARGFDRLPDHLPMTQGSSMARKQVTAGDFKAAHAALAASQPAQPVAVKDAARVPEIAALIEAGKAASLSLAEHEPYPLSACHALAAALRAIAEGRA